MSHNCLQFLKKKGEAETENIVETQGVAGISNSFGNDGGRGNLPGKPETNTEEKALENVELGGAMTSLWMI